MRYREASHRFCARPGHLAVVLLAAALFCNGCVLGPDYVRPDTDVPDSYRLQSPAATESFPDEFQPGAWWVGFGDPQLGSLVDQAVIANRDLGIAAARVEQYAARASAVRASGLPVVSYGTTAGRRSAPGAETRGELSAAFAVSWELDPWGRLRRDREAAGADLLSSHYGREAVKLAVISSVVTGYINLLELDRRLEVTRATLAGRAKNVEVFQMRLDGGALSEFEMLQVIAEYESAASAIPEIESAIAEQENALSVLIGQNPAPIHRSGTLRSWTQVPVPLGLPSQLLARRPDILQAEQQLVAANARIGAARALYFPSVSLTGQAGYASTALDALFSGPSRTWSFTGQLLGPIFAGGAIAAFNRETDARNEEARLAYQLTVQQAFRDVADALAALRARTELIEVLQRRVHVLRRALALAGERYDNGYADYLEVLDTERGLFSAELALTSAEGARFRSTVALYQALGGEWTTAPRPATETPVSR